MSINSQNDSELCQQLLNVSLKLEQSGLNRGAAGNVSVRAGQWFWITPSGVPTADLQLKDMVKVSIADGPAEDGPASSEWRFHRDILRARADVNAVVHTHSNYATAFAICGKPLPAAHYMIAAANTHEIGVAEYATFGTQALSDNALVTLGQSAKACLLANHGVLALGTNLANALHVAEEVETLAMQYQLALSIGQPNILPVDEIKRVIGLFANYGPNKETAS